MAKNEKIVAELKLTEEDLRNIHNAFCYINHVKNDLASVVRKEFLDKLDQQVDVFKKYFDPILDEQDRKEEEDREKLYNIRDENNFLSIWSDGSITAADMGKPCKLKFDSISYYDQEIKINKNNKPKTWLDIWKICEELIVKSGHEDHIFIEAIVVKDNKARLVTGS